MSLTYIQQELWVQEIDAFLTTMNVASQFCNTNIVPMEGGNQWNIISPSDVTTFDVDDSTDITYSAQTDAETQVTKNFDKGFGLIMLDSNKMQTTIPYQAAYAQNGAFQLSAALDTAILGEYANAGSDSFSDGSSTSWQFTKNTCAEVPSLLAKLRKTLRDSKVDANGMPYIVGPTGFGEAIDTYVSGRETLLGDQVLLAGGQRAFTLNGFRIFISNNCTTETSTTHGLCGVMNYGIALGTYMTPEMIEDLGRVKERYGNAIRGRLAAGYKVYQDAALIDVNFNETVVVV